MHTKLLTIMKKARKFGLSERRGWDSKILAHIFLKSARLLGFRKNPFQNRMNVFPNHKTFSHITQVFLIFENTVAHGIAHGYNRGRTWNPHSSAATTRRFFGAANALTILSIQESPPADQTGGFSLKRGFYGGNRAAKKEPQFPYSIHLTTLQARKKHPKVPFPLEVCML